MQGHSLLDSAQSLKKIRNDRECLRPYHQEISFDGSQIAFKALIKYMIEALIAFSIALDIC